MSNDSVGQNIEQSINVTNAILQQIPPEIVSQNVEKVQLEMREHFPL